MTSTTALIIVDAQHDFLPGGALAVGDGDRIIVPLTALLGRFDGPVVFTADHHPADHCSFVDNGGIWPPHCVADTPGASIHPALDADRTADVIVHKATTSDKDAYSGFDATGLAAKLRDRGVTDVLIGGLATDYCVKATVMDAISEGFRTSVLTDAIAAVDVNAGDGDRALTEMAAAGATLTTTEQVR